MLLSMHILLHKAPLNLCFQLVHYVVVQSNPFDTFHRRTRECEMKGELVIPGRKCSGLFLSYIRARVERCGLVQELVFLIYG